MSVTNGDLEHECDQEEVQWPPHALTKTGYLKLSLVRCPVALYPASS